MKTNKKVGLCILFFFAILYYLHVIGVYFANGYQWTNNILIVQLTPECIFWAFVSLFSLLIFGYYALRELLWK